MRAAGADALQVEPALFKRKIHVLLRARPAGSVAPIDRQRGHLREEDLIAAHHALARRVVQPGANAVDDEISGAVSPELTRAYVRLYLPAPLRRYISHVRADLVEESCVHRARARVRACVRVCGRGKLEG